MSDLDHLLAPLRDTGSSIEPVDAQRLITQGRQRARRRQTAAVSVLAVGVLIASGAVMVEQGWDSPRVILGSEIEGATPVAAPPGTLVAELETPAGLRAQARDQDGGSGTLSGVVAVFIEGPTGWYSTLTHGDPEAPALAVDDGHVVGVVPGGYRRVELGWAGQVHTADATATFTGPHGAQTLVALDTSPGAASGAPASTITVAGVTDRSSKVIGVVRSGADAATQHAPAKGEVPVEFPSSRGPEAITRTAWVGRDGWHCVSERFPNEQTSDTTCYEPRFATQRFIGEPSYVYYTFLPRAAASATIEAVGTTYPLTLHRFFRGTFAVASIGSEYAQPQKARSDLTLRVFDKNGKSIRSALTN